MQTEGQEFRGTNFVTEPNSFNSSPAWPSSFVHSLGTPLLRSPIPALASQTKLDTLVERTKDRQNRRSKETNFLSDG